MRRKSAISFLLPLVIAGLLNKPARAGDPAAGKIKAQEACQTCHGLNGIGTVPMAANLAGQPELYLIAQLKAYQSGKRRHEQMSIIARMLTADDIENLAAWYAGIKVTIDMPQ